MNDPESKLPITRAIPLVNLTVTAEFAASTEGMSITANSGPNIWPEIEGFVILEVLGIGGMGVVYKARQVALNRIVALKLIRSGSGISSKEAARFRTEAEAIAALSHPGVLQVYQFGEVNGMPFLALEYIRGGTLADRLKGKPISARTAAHLVGEVAAAVQAAHEAGIIHRDLKPANILLTGDPDTRLQDCKTKVSDFGLAKRLDAEEGQTITGAVLGTPGYMSPEQAQGKPGAIGPGTDVWALGAILYELLTGKRPFRGANVVDTLMLTMKDPPAPSSLNADIPRQLELVCLKCLQREIKDRYSSAGAVAEDLRRWLDGQRVTARPVKAKTPGRRWYWYVIGTFVALTLCCGGPVGFTWWVIDTVTNKARELSTEFKRTDTEWDAIMGLWQPPPIDADLETLFPSMLPEGGHRLRNDTTVADEELGITLKGKRAIYALPDGGEGEVRAYRCPEDEAKELEGAAYAYVESIRNKTRSPREGSSRHQAVYLTQNTMRHSVTFGFADAQGANNEYVKLWYSHGWLFYFRTTEIMAIESFPAKYLMEVGKRASASKK